MEQNKLAELVSNIEEKKLSEFIEKNQSEYELKTDAHTIKVDLTWLEKVEETLQPLDNIVRNPKRFLSQLEDVVPVEKAKKISVESIVHLSQHTNLIQDISEEGLITPSKVLTIEKEETYELYENRFIYTLLKNACLFIAQRKKELQDGAFSKRERTLTFKAKTKVKNETINIDMNIQTSSYEELLGVNTEGLSVEDRIDRVDLMMKDLMRTDFGKSLERCIPVRPPIRKTNVLLKNPDFQQALKLWDYIYNYKGNDKQEEKINSVEKDDLELKNNLDLGFFINYDILNQFSDKKEGNKRDSNYYLKKIIEDFVNENKEINVTEFKKVLSKAFTMYKQKKIKRDKSIYQEFDKCIKKYNKNVKEAIKILNKSL